MPSDLRSTILKELLEVTFFGPAPARAFGDIERDRIGQQVGGRDGDEAMAKGVETGEGEEAIKGEGTEEGGVFVGEGGGEGREEEGAVKEASSEGSAGEGNFLVIKAPGDLRDLEEARAMEGEGRREGTREGEGEEEASQEGGEEQP